MACNEGRGPHHTQAAAAHVTEIKSLSPLATGSWCLATDEPGRSVHTVRWPRGRHWRWCRAEGSVSWVSSAVQILWLTGWITAVWGPEGRPLPQPFSLASFKPEPKQACRYCWGILKQVRCRVYFSKEILTWEHKQEQRKAANICVCVCVCHCFAIQSAIKILSLVPHKCQQLNCETFFISFSHNKTFILS